MTKKEKRRRKKMRRYAIRHKKRYGVVHSITQDRHHLTPKSLGGKSDKSNILWIKVIKHRAWHTIFGLLTIEEVVELLERLIRIKKRGGQDVLLSEMCKEDEDEWRCKHLYLLQDNGRIHNG